MKYSMMYLALQLGGCSASLGAAPSLRQQAAAAAQRGDVAQQADWLGQILCQNPQAHDAAAVARLASELQTTWATPRHLPCTLPESLSTVLAAMDAGAAAQWPEAARLLTHAAYLAPPPWHPDILMRQAQVALHLGKTSQAYAYLRQAQTRAPQRVDVRLLMAQTLLGQGEAEAAIDVVRALLDLVPKPHEIARGRSLVESAIRSVEPTLSAAASAAAAELAAAMEKDHIDAAELHHLLALTRTVGHPRVVTMAGFVALQCGALATALQLLEQAQEQNPLDPDPPRIVAGYYAAQHLWQTALPPLREAARRDPLNAQVLALLAPTAIAADDLHTAAQAYRRLLVLEPQTADYQAGLAQVEQQLAERAAGAATTD